MHLTSAIALHRVQLTRIVATLCAMILKDQLAPMFGDENSLPPEIKAYADMLLAQNKQDFAAAEALGWTDKDGVEQ